MVLKPDYSKPAQEMLLSRKKKTSSNLPNNNPGQFSNQKSVLSKMSCHNTRWKRSFKRYIDSAISKTIISLIGNVKHRLSRKPLDTVHKASKRPWMDYRDIIYNKPQNESFPCKSLQ